MKASLNAKRKYRFASWRRTILVDRGVGMSKLLGVERRGGGSVRARYFWGLKNAMEKPARAEIGSMKRKKAR